MLSENPSLPGHEKKPRGTHLCHHEVRHLMRLNASNRCQGEVTKLHGVAALKKIGG